MATFNGNDYTLADFTAGDGFDYVEIWDGFWSDVLTEMTSRAAAIGAGLIAISTSSVTIGTGSKSFDVGTGKGFVAGMWVTAVDAGNSANSLTGNVTGYNSGTGMLALSVPAGATTGSGTIAAWTLGIGGKPGAAGADGATGGTGPVTTYWGGTAGGTANALAATTGYGLTVLTVGQVIGVNAAALNTGTSTLSVDGLTAVPIRKNGAALVGGELQAGTDVWFQYDGAYFRMLGGAGGGLSLPVTTKTTNYPAAAADAGKVLKFSSAATLTLPTASSLPAGWAILVSNRSSGSITIAAGSGDTVNGQSIQLLRQFFDLLVYRNGSTSFEVSAFGSAAVSSSSTWNPADVDSTMVLSNGNLTITSSGGGPGGMRAGRATTSIVSGAYYYEFSPIAPDGCLIGWATAAASLAGYLGIDASGWSYGADGKRWNNSSGVTYGTTWGTGTHRIGCYAKSTATNVWNLWVSVDGVVQGGGDPIAGTSPMYSGVGGPIFPAFGDNSSATSSSGTAYFSPTGWLTVPPGFNPLP